MKKTLLILSLFTLSFIGTACSSDDNSSKDTEQVVKPDPGKQENLLVGTWQIKTIHFTKFVEEGIPASDACMIEGLTGYEFKKDKTFVFLAGENSAFDPSAKKYWEWSANENSFEIKQLNIAMPPYNFGLTTLNLKVEKSGDTHTMSFKAELANGSQADFVLEKTKVDPSIASKITLPNGDVFSCGLFSDPVIKKSDLLNSTWILEKGQEVFKQTFDTSIEVTQSDRAKSVLVYSFLQADKSLFKYTFPMGVISAKEDTWTWDDKQKSFKTAYHTENSFAKSDMRFTVLVKKISDSKLEFTFTDDKGTNLKRTFVKYDTFISTTDQLDGINEVLNEIVAAGEKK
ncbi:hypothetical protein NWE55_13765 [Myroides albus]|uniref:hypothetical protein n=1 Tax=Myroides albus TaxID=2562892 RepID=UPI002158A58E|nr:hypothetical protein [Myroides albus]UVD79180.1 hypothetical protein NWE55_13765 [Myroides albus]